MALGVSIAAYAVLIIVGHQPFHLGTRALRFFDLRVYRGAAERVVHHLSPYGTPLFKGLGFTYPPFAALLLTPLACLPLTVDESAVTAGNLFLLVWVLHRTPLIASYPGANDVAPKSRPGCSWSTAALLAAAALWLEPVSVTVGYGQIDLLIAALVVFDLSRPDDARGKGAAIGLASAIKLTPLLFIAFLMFSRRKRAAAWAIGVFGASIGLAYMATGQDASRYWGELIFRTSRVGNASDPANQSLHGAIVRFDPAASSTLASHVLILIIALGGLGLAARASRVGDEAAGFSLAALTTLLASPVSWTHHWTLAVPALVLLGHRAHRRRTRQLTMSATALTAIGYAYLPEWTEGHRLPAGLDSLTTTDPYVTAATIVLATSATTVARARVRDRITASKGKREPANRRSVR